LEYFLRVNVIHSAPTVELSKGEFIRLKNAKSILDHAFRLEENYDIVLKAYLELEKSMLEFSMDNVVHNITSYFDVYQPRVFLNYKVLSFLTSTRVYLDQHPQLMPKCVPEDADLSERVGGFISEQYDQHFEYRFMEALRNYAQHCGLPIHSFSHGGMLNELEELEFTLDIYATKSFLAKDNKFKPKVLNEMPESVNLKKAIRRYMESIGEIHVASRNAINSSIDSAREVLDEAYNRYSQQYEHSQIGLTAYKQYEEKRIEEVLLLKEWDDVREALVNKNGTLGKLTKKVVHSRAKKK